MNKARNDNSELLDIIYGEDTTSEPLEEEEERHEILDFSESEPLKSDLSRILEDMDTSNVDAWVSMIEERQNATNAQPLNERINKYIKPTYDNNKHPNIKGRKKTGEFLIVPLVPNLAVVDVDFDKEQSEEAKREAFDFVMGKLKDSKIGFYEKTTSGGLHVYCNVDTFDLGNNERMLEVAKDSMGRFALDIFAYNDTIIEHNATMGIMKWNSTAKGKNGQIGKYELLHGDPNEPITDSLDDVLHCLGLYDEVKNKINKKVKPPLPTPHNETLKLYESIDESEDPKLTPELYQAITQGFKPEHFPDGFQIHAHTTASINERVANLQIISALKDCERLGFDVYEFMGELSMSPLLTVKARGELMTEYPKHNYNPRDTWRALIKILRIYAPKYWEDNIKEKDANVSIDEQFESSRFTLSEFLSKTNTYHTITEALDKLKLCVACIRGGGNLYACKDYTRNGEIGYFKISKNDLKARLDETIDIRTSEDEQEQMRKSKKRITEFKPFKLQRLIVESRYKCQLKQYAQGCEIYSNNPQVLSLWIPPAPKEYKRQLIHDWVQFIESLIDPLHIVAFHELLASIAYRLRNPSAFIAKFFVQYGKGNDGKSYLTKCLGRIFGQCANLGVKFDQITKDQFNGWTTDHLMLWLEEVQGNRDNVDNLKLSELVKQMTTENASIRRMYQENTEAKNIAIIGLNTNQRDLKGLTRADDATKSRLVIIKYREGNNERNGGSAAFTAKCGRFLDDEAFAYSLYYYLMHEYAIPQTFNINRYEGKEKDDFINESNVSYKTTAEAWLADVLSGSEYSKYDLFIDKRKVKNGEEFVRIKRPDATQSFRAWCNDNKTYHQPRDLTVELQKLGFTVAKIKGIYYYKLNIEEFEKLKRRLTDDCEVIEEEDLEEEDLSVTI